MVRAFIFPPPLKEKLAPTEARAGKLTVVSLVKLFKTNESLIPTISEEDKVVRLSIVGLLKPVMLMPVTHLPLRKVAA